MGKCKRCKWEITDDLCWDCGSYTEHCYKCGTVRFRKGNGKVESQLTPRGTYKLK